MATYLYKNKNTFNQIALATFVSLFSKEKVKGNVTLLFILQNVNVRDSEFFWSVGYIKNVSSENKSLNKAHTMNMRLTAKITHYILKGSSWKGKCRASLSS